MVGRKLDGGQFVVLSSIKYLTTQLRFFSPLNPLRPRLMWLLKAVAGIVSKILGGQVRVTGDKRGLVSLAQCLRLKSAVNFSWSPPHRNRQKSLSPHLSSLCPQHQAGMCHSMLVRCEIQNSQWIISFLESGRSFQLPFGVTDNRLFNL